MWDQAVGDGEAWRAYDLRATGQRGVGRDRGGVVGPRQFDWFVAVEHQSVSQDCGHVGGRLVRVRSTTSQPPGPVPGDHRAALGQAPPGTGCVRVVHRMVRCTAPHLPCLPGAGEGHPSGTED